MDSRIARDLVSLKRAFAESYSGTAHIQEVIPSPGSGHLPVPGPHLEALHLFAGRNPVYYNSYEQKVGGVRCIAYEGDINRYWLDSIRHGSSRAPFSPTWMTSAYAAALLARDLGASEAVDVGSGDGRLAYCARVLGLDSFAVEIDPTLADLQRAVSSGAGTRLDPACCDAAAFDYSSLALSRPAFFIGGLAQMGGEAMALPAIRWEGSSEIRDGACFVFAGTYSGKYPRGDRYGGWGGTISRHGLKVVGTVMLPTVWTFGEPEETPYVFARFG